jgi:hypothetical protein
MLPALLLATLPAFTIGDDPTNPVDITAAMASRETGCVTVTEVVVVEQPTQHIQFHMHTDPPSGGSLIWTASGHRFALGETYPHPRASEVSLAFAELADDHAQRDSVRANRDAIIGCFRAVL